MWTDPRKYRTCADPEPRYLSIRNVDGTGQGRSEGTQSRPAYNAYLRLFEVLRDPLGEEFETSSEGQLSVSHGISIGRLMDLGCGGQKPVHRDDQVEFFSRAHTGFPFLSTSPLLLPAPNQILSERDRVQDVV